MWWPELELVIPALWGVEAGGSEVQGHHQSVILQPGTYKTLLQKKKNKKPQIQTLSAKCYQTQEKYYVSGGGQTARVPARRKLDANCKQYRGGEPLRLQHKSG